MKSFSLLLLSICLLAGCSNSPLPSRPGATHLSSQDLTTIVYDQIGDKDGVVKAIGQNRRVGTPDTPVILSAKVASAVPIEVDKAVFAIRREGTENLDIGHVSCYSIGDQEQAFTASGNFAPGNYTFWFAYFKDGEWHNTDKRAFTISSSQLPDVPLEPVDASEPGGELLRAVGADTSTGVQNQTVRLVAKLSTPVPIKLDSKDVEGEEKPQLIFAIRDAQGRNFDTFSHRVIPAVIGENTELRSEVYLPAGTYTYQVAYAQEGQWRTLGKARTFVLAPAPVVPVPGPGNPDWQENDDAWEDFNGDLSRWTPLSQVGYQHSGVLGYSNNNATVKDGELILSARKEPTVTSDGTFDYSAGAVQSNFNIPAGPSYVEVRAKVLSSKANVLSAIWLQTFGSGVEGNPNPEIDIQETFNYANMSSGLHTWKTDAGGNHLPEGHDSITWSRPSTGLADISTDYHTYGLERRDGWLRFYFDHHLTWAVKPNVTELTTMPRRMLLTLEGHLKQPKDEFLPSTYNIDYVHTYSYKKP